MNHKFYYRILTLFAIGICMCLPPSTSYGQTSSQGNQGWECDACNDNNPCTFDFCFYGYCFNLPLRNCGQQRVCDLKVIYAKTTNCYYDAVAQKNKATLKVCVWWRDADPSKDLKVYINGQTKTIDIRNATGDACVEFTVDANGTQNNRVWTEFVGNTDCKAEKRYNVPASCTPSCDLKITNVSIDDCYFDQADNKSKAEITVCVEWDDRPNNENIVVALANQQKLVKPAIGIKEGNKCVKFIIPADGTQNNLISAAFQATTTCNDTYKYTAPRPCFQAPPCDIDITHVSVGDCYFDNASSKSKADLTVCVQWENRPNNDNIMVSIVGQAVNIVPNSTTGIIKGNKCVKFTVTADGTSYNGIWAKFINHGTCQDEAYYQAPSNCQPAPPCNVNIKTVSVGSCYFDAYDSKSRAELTICVEWKNRPGNENIYVSINDQYQVIYPTTTSGIKCVKFNVLANGTQNNGIWAKFQYTPCQDDDKYNAPAPCLPQPVCDIKITSATVGACYFDPADNTSKAELTVCVAWKTPVNQNIVVTIDGQPAQLINTGGVDGSKCVKFIIPANGPYNDGIWAYFQQTTSCTADAFYTIPAPCLPQPVCDIKITSATVGACYFDPTDNTSKAELTVCVAWKTPVNQNIVVTIDGQPAQLINTGGVDGSKCVKFIIPANGPYNDGIWAYFQQTTSCTADAFYTIPAPCLPLPVCDIKITSATVGACYFDPADNTSKAELTVCVAWKTPVNQNIVVTIDGQPAQIINTGGVDGSQCVKFIVPANGPYNDGIWAYFQQTTSCTADAFYTIPAPCLPLPVCDIKITSATVGACYFDPADNTSKAELTVCVEWKTPVNQNIVVTIDGQPAQLINTGGVDGSQCVKFIIPANGPYNDGIWAYFQQTTSCTADAFYTIPAPCLPQPVCDIKITSATVGACYFDPADNTSKAELTVCVEWKTPVNQNIVVTIDGQPAQLINTGGVDGSQCVKFIIPANGPYNDGIWAYFQQTTSCTADAFYTIPAPCLPQPVCDIKITSATVGACYFDPADNTSKAELTVCVEWKTPVNQNIVVTIDGQPAQLINTGGVDGSQCVKFIVPANGPYNDGIWAYFQQTTSCTADAFYTIPAPCLPQPVCDIKITSATVGACYFDPTDNTSKAELTVCVEWKTPVNQNIVVTIDGQPAQLINTGGVDGSQCVKFIVPANGPYNDGIWAYFQQTTSCTADAFYTIPAPCLPLPVCDIKITSATVGACYFDPADNTSKAELTVCVEWKTPVNQNIVVTIDGQPAQLINTGGVDGSQCVKFIVPANGPYNDGIWAYFQQTTSCTADAFYTIPAPCLPQPVCDIKITSATVGACYFDPTDNTSKAELTVCVEWKTPVNQNIVVTIDGQPAQLINTGGVDGSQCVKFIVPANGPYNDGIWAYFQQTTSCTADAFYTIPAPCLPLPVCDIKITSATVGACYFDPADNTSKAELTVCVEWKTPVNQNIVVTIDGQPAQLINTGGVDGSKCVKFIVPANGPYNDGIWAYFQQTTSCTADAFYTIPAPCLPQPVCNLNITSVTVGQCYFDQSDNKSKAELTVCVEWKDRPGTENIYVSISGYYQVINTSATSVAGTNSGTGNKCVKFIIPANGSSNNVISARFQYSTTCQDESRYHAPNACNQAPVCDLNITSVSVSNCYYDPVALQSKAELTVCVSWKNRPNNERIFITISGQKGMITPSQSTGNGCVKFTVPANATTNNGIWAMFEFTASCQDEAYYHCPLPCTYTPPSCALKITKTEVGNCYYDHIDNKSKVKLKICLQWDAAPANEKIILKVGNSTNYIYSNASSGGICLEYILLANGAQNIEVWARFESTYSCFQKKYFNAPSACNSNGRVVASDNKPQDANVQAFNVDKTESTPDVAIEDATEQTASYNLATTSTTATHDLRVFPNPTSEELSVDLTSFAGKKVHLQVFNTVGQVMYQTTIDEVNTDKVQLDVRKYTNDMYFLKVNVLNEGTYTQKFVVKR